MKTPDGFLNVRFYVFGGWGLSITLLRTYRNKLLYFRGDISDDTKNFLRYAEQITVDKVALYNAFVPCLDWKEPDKTIITFDSTRWELTLRLDDRTVSFYHDTGTDEFNELVRMLEGITQKPFY